MTLRTTVPVSFCLCLLATAVMRGQQAAPTFRSRVDAVEIDAYVADRHGTPVEDLTAADFELLENGVPQRLDSFGLVRVPVPAAPPAIAAEVQTNTDSDGRLYAIALDDMDAATALRASALLRRFITANVAANDLVTIVSVGSLASRATQDFTGHKPLLLKALDAFDGGVRSRPIAQRVQGEAFRNLLESIGRIPHRRKALLYVTTRLFDLSDILRGGEQNDVVDLGVIRDGLAIAMRGNVAVYAIDPTGLENVGAGGDAQVARGLTATDLNRIYRFQRLSDATGGFAIVNSNGFDAAFDRIVRENTTYYMLGFSSTDARRNGQFRRIEIRVRRPGLVVRAREGYIAPEATPPVLHTTVSTGVRFAPAIAEVLDHPIENPAVPMWVTAKAGASSGRDADVIVTADMDAAAVGEPDAEIELGAVAVNAAGTVVRAQRERFQPSAARSGADGAPLRVSRAMTISLPPGHYQLRVAAGNTGSTRAGSVLYDLDIPQPR